MGKIFKIFTVAGLAVAGLSQPVHAQSHEYDTLRSQNRLGVNAGVHITVPLGAKRKNHAEDKARFGLKLSASRTTSSPYSSTRNIHNMDMLDLGFHTDGQPSLMLYGQDIYRPLFDPLHADETETPDGEAKPKPKGNGNTAALIIIGGAAVAGLVVLTAEAVDEFNDCFLVFVDVPEKCKS